MPKCGPLTERSSRRCVLPMQRAGLFRMSTWRLGLFVLAAYALVLQGMLGNAGPRALDADAIATMLCADGAAAPGGSHQPVHNGGDCGCAFHCQGSFASPPLASAFAFRTPDVAASSALISLKETSRPPRTSRNVSARGPPVETVFPV